MANHDDSSLVIPTSLSYNQGSLDQVNPSHKPLTIKNDASRSLFNIHYQHDTEYHAFQFTIASLYKLYNNEG